MFFAASEGILTGVHIGNVYMSGFFETQSNWVVHVNNQLDVLMAAAPTSSVQIIRYGDNVNGSPFIQLVMTADAVETCIIKDVLDGDMPYTSQGNFREFENAGLNNLIQQGDSSGQLVVQATPVQPPWGYPLPSARTMVGSPSFTSLGPYGTFGFFPYPPADAPLENGYPYDGGDPSGLWPSNRIYLESVDGLVVGQTLCVKDGDDSAAFLNVTSIDTTDRWITVTVQNSGRPVYISDQHTIVPVGQYGASTDWSGFMANVVAKSVEANLGRTPHITAADVNSTGWSALWTTYPFSTYWRLRNYQFLQPTKVKDILVPEFQATGWMGRLGADGRLDVAQLPFVSPQRTAAHSITDDEILYPAEGFFGMWPTWEAQRDGLVNIVFLRLGYSPIMDEYDSKYDFVIRMTASISEHKSGDKAKQEIAPKSTPGAGIVRRAAAVAAITARNGKPSVLNLAPSAEEIAEMVSPYLQTLSQDYATVTLAVPFTKFDILCGDIVSITSAFIPDGTGARGVSGKKAICVGREWNLDPKSNAMGKLTFWFSRDFGKTAGYAPTGRVTGQSNTSGNIWVISFLSSNFRNISWSEDNDGDVTKHFEIGDGVEVLRVDVTTETRVNGVVTDKPADGQLEVTFDAAWTPGANTWNLRFSMNTGGGASAFSDHQAAYCYVADSNGVLAYNGGVGRSFL
jgi:hypothetical protein